jgi:hypothetical protein
MFWRIFSEFRPKAGRPGNDAPAPPTLPAAVSTDAMQTAEELRVLGGCHGCSGKLIGVRYESGALHARKP